MLFKILTAALTVLAVVGCTTIAPPTTVPIAQPTWQERQIALNQIHHWQIKGKIAVQTAQDAGSAGVDWTQNKQSYTVTLLTPLGTTALQLTGQPHSVTLITSDGKHFTANSPEQLLAQQWGFNLPISNLMYWVRGLPVPNIPFTSQLDAQHCLSQLTQQGFSVQFESYTIVDNVMLPERLTITSPTIKVKMVIHKWQTFL
jgi:outer membrane lipoprotein LolB